MLKEGAAFVVGAVERIWPFEARTSKATKVTGVVMAGGDGPGEAVELLGQAGSGNEFAVEDEFDAEVAEVGELGELSSDLAASASPDGQPGRVDAHDGPRAVDLAPVTSRERGVREHVGLGAVEEGGGLGELAVEDPHDLVQLGCGTPRLSGWAKIVRTVAATMSFDAEATVPRMLRIRWTLQRCQLAPASTRGIEAFNPA